MRIMGVDPGVENFAVVVVDGHKVVYARMIRNTIRSMARAAYEQRALYRNSMQRLLKSVRPDAVLMEQFAVRGFGTQLTEVINIMIGGLQMLCDLKGITEDAIMASTWKRAFKKIGDLDAMYAYAKKLEMEHHIVDATCIAMFARNNLSFTKADVGRIKKGLIQCQYWIACNSPDHIRKPRAKKRTHK